MDEVVIKKEFDKVFLYIKKESAQEEDYALMMITQNIIPGFLKCKVCFLEEIECYGYDISSLKTLEKEYEDSKIGFLDLKNLFYSLYQIIRSANEFLLDQSGFLFQPQYIFKDMETGEISCLFLPEQDNVQMKRYHERGIYRELADFLLDKLNHRDEHAVNVAYQFYKMSKEDFFSFEVFIGLIEKEEVMHQVKEKKNREIKIPISNMDAWKEDELKVEENNKEFLEYEEIADNDYINWWIPGILLGVGIILVTGYLFITQLQTYAIYILVPGLAITIISLIFFVRNILLIYKNVSESINMKMEKDVSIEEYFGDALDEETVYFDDTAYLSFRWKEDGCIKEFELSEFPASIGKLKEDVEIVIEDVSVSRMHACVKEKGNAVLLQDLDSTNGTFVNGKRLIAGEEVIIKRNDEIQFGKIIVNVV